MSGIAFKAIQQWSCQRVLDISPYLAKAFETINVDDLSICLKVDDTIINYGNTLCKKTSQQKRSDTSHNQQA